MGLCSGKRVLQRTETTPSWLEFQRGGKKCKSFLGHCFARLHAHDPLLCCCGQRKRRTSLSFLKRSPSSRSHCWHAVACCCPQTRRNRRPTPKLEAPPRRQRETLAKWAPFALCADACLMWLHCIGTSANAKLTQITLRWSEGESNWIATPSEVSLSLSASRPLSHNPARPATSVGEKS